MRRIPLVLLLSLAIQLPASVADEVDWGLRSLPTPLALDHLRDQVSKGPLEQRLEALRLIAQSGRDPARPVVLQAATEHEERVAIDALRHLASMGPGRLAEDRQLRFVLGRAEPMVRAAALDCFGSWGERRFVPDIAVLLGDAAPQVRTQVAETLTRLSGERLGVDIEAWKQWYAVDQAEAQKRLDEVSQRIADPDQAVDEPTVATLAAMRGHTSEAVELLLPLLNRNDPRTLAAVVRTLRVIRPTLVKELDPRLLSDLPGPPPAAGIAAAPAVGQVRPAPSASSEGSSGPWLLAGVVAAIVIGLWLLFRRTAPGQTVGQGSRALAAVIGRTSGAMVVKLKGKRHADVAVPPSGLPRP
jgi:hypothetical protein